MSFLVHDSMQIWGVTGWALRSHTEMDAIDFSRFVVQKAAMLLSGCAGAHVTGAEDRIVLLRMCRKAPNMRNRYEALHKENVYRCAINFQRYYSAKSVAFAFASIAATCSA